MIIPMLCVTIFVILVVWFLLPRVARLMIHTPTAISIFVCLSMVQLDRKSGSAGMPRPISYAVFCLKKKRPPEEPAVHAGPPPRPAARRHRRCDAGACRDGVVDAVLHPD